MLSAWSFSQCFLLCDFGFSYHVNIQFLCPAKFLLGVWGYLLLRHSVLSLSEPMLSSLIWRVCQHELVSWGCCCKHHKLGACKQQALPVSHFWRLQVHNQGVSKAMLLLSPVGDITSFTYFCDSFWKSSMLLACEVSSLICLSDTTMCLLSACLHPQHCPIGTSHIGSELTLITG